MQVSETLVSESYVSEIINLQQKQTTFPFADPQAESVFLWLRQRFTDQHPTIFPTYDFELEGEVLTFRFLCIEGCALRLRKQE
jgi:hypothetical protein